MLVSNKVLNVPVYKLYMCMYVHDCRSWLWSKPRCTRRRQSSHDVYKSGMTGFDLNYWRRCVCMCVYVCACALCMFWCTDIFVFPIPLCPLCNFVLLFTPTVCPHPTIHPFLSFCRRAILNSTSIIMGGRLWRDWTLEERTTVSVTVVIQSWSINGYCRALNIKV